MDPPVARQIEASLGSAVVEGSPLSGGCIAPVYRVRLADGREVVVKLQQGAGGPGLEPEAFMLRFLAQRSRLPVPRVLWGDDSLLAMEYVESDGRGGPSAEQHAADLLADLHGIRPNPPHASCFGLERNTLIGSLEQPNRWTPTWVGFFARQRLVYMAGQAARHGSLPGTLERRVAALASRLSELIDEPAAPSLVHGDAWSGNVLVRAGRIAAFLDPAVYFAHAEVELAFITLFSTFGSAFFDRYAELRPIAPGFFENRRHVYNLYPLLVHARLFGGSYVGDVEATLRRLGF